LPARAKDYQVEAVPLPLITAATHAVVVTGVKVLRPSGTAVVQALGSCLLAVRATS